MKRSAEEGTSDASTNKTNHSRSTSARSKHSARVAAQTSIDAKLHDDFEDSGKQYNYSTSVDFNNISGSTSNVPSSAVSAYLQNIQRGRLIQSFGCVIAFDEQQFRVLAYSGNAPEMLDITPHTVPSIGQQEGLNIGTDVRTLFRSSGAAALQKAAIFSEVSLLNPILVHCKTSGKPFYAILHRIDVGIVIDLEPVNPADVPITAAGALKSYKLAAKAISRLQSLTTGNIKLLCDVLVKEVSELTGYDRVMVYKFHEDEHGEVIAESCNKSDLEPYLGLHYPATDIPQASRFLFMKNKVRMICDCLAPPVKVIQDKRLYQPLSLCGSALRSPHGCHTQYMANMGSIASLAMSVTINDDEDDEIESNQQKGRKLWGLVVCHHTSPRFVPFPLRYACEFLIQVFGVCISKEVELASQLREKHILQTQTVLCDMLLRNAPIGIVTQSPNVMDLVKCDGAALYYKKKSWLLGSTPTDPQLRDITDWLLEYDNGSTGLSTDSLVEAGYPGALSLGDAVCGMAAIKITSKDFLFWFRSHTAKEIKWGGAKHNPNEKDDGRKMHPRLSFKAFLDVVKRRSLPWEDIEMDVIHSLQLILRGSLQDADAKMIVNVPLQKMDELRMVTTEMVRLIETAAVPIFAVDATGAINGWNVKAVELTGFTVQQAIGMPLLNLLERDSIHVVKNMLNSALQGIEEKNVEIKVKKFGYRESDGPVILVVNACCTRDVGEKVVGVCFVGQDITQQKMVMDKYTHIQGDYANLIRSPSPLIPPVFMIDDQGRCSEWNHTMQNLSGLTREEAVGKMLLGEVFTVSNFGCRVKDHDTLTKLRIILNRVMAGQDVDKLVFGFYNQHDKYIEAILSANKKCDEEGNINGILCFLHVASPELQYAMQVQKMSEHAATNSLKKLTYLRRELIKPLNGIKFIQNGMIESSSDNDLSNEQKQLLKYSSLCQEQVVKIVNDTDIAGIEECYMEMDHGEFNLGEVLEVVINEVMILSQERQIQVRKEFAAGVSTMYLYGDNLRLQQVLSDFLRSALVFSPVYEEQGSIITFKVSSRKECIGKKIRIVHLEFRIAHAAPGMPDDLVDEMFNHNNRESCSREGLGLYICQKLVKNMNGTVQYVREAERSSFIILIEFPLSGRTD